jgi:hypothetical protein
MAAPTFVAATRPTAGWGDHSSATTLTTPSFSVTSGDVLVVLAFGDDANITFTSASGGSLTWTRQEHVGTSGSTSRGAIFTATASSTTSITVTVTKAGTNTFWGFVVHQWRGSAGVGAHTSQANAVSGVAPSLALTTTGANSAISYGSADWTSSDGTTRTWRTINSITPTAANTLETDYFRDGSGTQYTVYVGDWSDAGAAGSKTTGLTAPSTQRPAIVAIEILGSAAAGPVAKLITVNRAVMRAAYW